MRIWKVLDDGDLLELKDGTKPGEVLTRSDYFIIEGEGESYDFGPKVRNMYLWMPTSCSQNWQSKVSAGKAIRDLSLKLQEEGSQPRFDYINSESHLAASWGLPIGDRAGKSGEEKVDSMENDRKSLAFFIPPINAAMDAAKKFLGPNPVKIPNNQEQKSFLEKYYEKDPPDYEFIKSIASRSTDEIRKFLSDNGFSDVQFPSIDPGTMFGMVGILDILANWITPAETSKLKGGDGTIYDAVKFEHRQDVSFFGNSEHDFPVVKIKAKAGFKVYFTHIDDTPYNNAADCFRIHDLACKLTKEEGERLNFEPLYIPKITFDGETDVKWMLDLKTKTQSGNEYRLIWGVMKAKLRLNHLGARAQGMFGGVEYCGIPSSHLLFDKPFLIWFTFNDKVMYTAYITEEHWNDPGDDLSSDYTNKTNEREEKFKRESHFYEREEALDNIRREYLEEMKEGIKSLKLLDFNTMPIKERKVYKKYPLPPKEQEKVNNTLKNAVSNFKHGLLMRLMEPSIFRNMGNENLKKLQSSNIDFISLGISSPLVSIPIDVEILKKRLDETKIPMIVPKNLKEYNSDNYEIYGSVKIFKDEFPTEKQRICKYLNWMFKSREGGESRKDLVKFKELDDGYYSVNIRYTVHSETKINPNIWVLYEILGEELIIELEGCDYEIFGNYEYHRIKDMMDEIRETDVDDFNTFDEVLSMVGYMLDEKLVHKWVSERFRYDPENLEIYLKRTEGFFDSIIDD